MKTRHTGAVTTCDHFFAWQTIPAEVQNKKEPTESIAKINLTLGYLFYIMLYNSMNTVGGKERCCHRLTGGGGGQIESLLS